MANIVPQPNQAPEKAPEPVIVQQATTRKNRGRESLRIDLAGSGPRTSGVNV